VLDPGERSLLLESLRPPPGYRLDFAIATTFTLDLLALLTTPLAFTFFDWEAEDGRPTAEPLMLLEAIRRHADRIAVFCEAGHVVVPRDQQPLYTFLEDSVIEVKAPFGGIFHPKVWVLRFETDSGPAAYRALCLSRNLTFDRSWDTALRLDGPLTDRELAFAKNHPLGDFFQALPSLATRPVPAAVRDKVDQIQYELRRVKFEFPESCEKLVFWPLGIEGHRRWPLGGRVDRMAIISPFVTRSFLERVSDPGRADVLISRLEELSRLDLEVLERFEHVYAMSAEAAPEEQDEADEAPDTGGTAEETGLQGLHAKIYVADSGWESRVWVGSANATDAAFNNNVEFLVELHGKKSRFGIDQLLQPGETTITFHSLLQPFIPADEPLEADLELKAAERLADDARTELVNACLEAHVDVVEDASTCQLSLMHTGKSKLNLKHLCRVKARAWPILTSERVAATDLDVGGKIFATFRSVSIEAISAFFAFDLTARHGGKEVRRRFVLNLPLVGAPPGRRGQVLRAMLKDRDSILRFLLMLLSAEIGELAKGDGAYVDDFQFRGGPLRGLGATLFEALVHALDREPARLDQIADLVKDLRANPETAGLLPEGFDDIWKPIWSVRQRLAT